MRCDQGARTNLTTPSLLGVEEATRKRGGLMQYLISLCKAHKAVFGRGRGSECPDLAPLAAATSPLPPMSDERRHVCAV